MAVKQETAYQKKIDELKAEHQKTAQAVDSKRGELDALTGEVKRLGIQKRDLEGKISELTHDVENMDRTIVQKRSEAEGVLKEVRDQVSGTQLVKDSLEFESKQLEERIARRQQKADELESVAKRHAELTAAITELERQAQILREANAAAKQTVDLRVAQADRIHAEAASRAANVAEQERALVEKQKNIEFYRNRVAQYLAEKGLPPMPDFNEA